ncbi:MAG: nucleotidyltransferase domain-containing protein [Pirellulales bacterium]|nr:nucleotidyltransferase domain-containing protein [Pirellulales bacterium]
MVAIIQDKMQELEALCREYDVVKLEVFGSAVTGEFDEAKSDLDFLVEFEYTESRNAFHQYFDFLFALEELFGRSVDLVCTKAMRNRYFIESVNQSRMPIYDR